MLHSDEDTWGRALGDPEQQASSARLKPDFSLKSDSTNQSQVLITTDQSKAWKRTLLSALIRALLLIMRIGEYAESHSN